MGSSELGIKELNEKLGLANEIIGNSLEGIMVTDENGIIESVNPAFTKITGFKEEDAVGQSSNILCSHQHTKEFFKEMWNEIRDKGHWSGEVWNRKKSGDAYSQYLSITTYSSVASGIKKYIGFFYDLTNDNISKEPKDKVELDPLTNIPARALFTDRLTHAINSCIRNKTTLGVMLLGLDGFQKINESLGLSAGDKILKESARRLYELARQTDTVARFGGDEFALVLEDVKNLENAAKVSEKIVRTFAEPFNVDGETVFITASIGMALCPADADNADSLVRNSDTAMHRAKQQGGNNCQFFTREMNEKAMQRLSVERDLRSAVERDEFLVYYQPKVNVETGEIVGMESLVRWNHPVKRLLPPGVFIPIAEETGLVVQIGRYVLRESCRINKMWQDMGYPLVKVAVNLSARHFQEDDIISEVQNVLDDTGLLPRYLELEITESMVMKDVEKAIGTLQELHNMGISLAVDDFGTGYSSFGYLKRFPIDALKIDMMFIKGMENSKEDQAMVAAIISMAHNLNLKVIAEGVEEAEQVTILRGFNCDQIQGYFYSKPVEAKSFEKLLRESKITD